MQHDTINVRPSALSNAVLTIQRLSNHTHLCKAALESHSDGSAALAPIVETLADCGTELQQLHACLDAIVSSTDQQQGGEA